MNIDEFPAQDLYDLLKPDVRMQRDIQRADLFDYRPQRVEARLNAVYKGIVFLGLLVDEWDVGVLEWRAVLKIFKEALPSSVNRKPVICKGLFENAAQFLSVRARAVTWYKVQLGVEMLAKEFEEPLGDVATKLARKIRKLLRPKRIDQIKRGYLDWEEQMREKPPKPEGLEFFQEF